VPRRTGIADPAAMLCRMLTGALVGLRARHDMDIPILEDEILADVEQSSRIASQPWRPISPGADSLFSFTPSPESAASFSVLELDGGTLAGAAMLRAIDSHNRSAHIGLALRPAFRGRGLGTDTVRVLCHYAFVTLGLQRVQAETVADNDAMIRSAEHVGFTREGLLRKQVWVQGGFRDVVVLGVLADEWAQR
jgi:RimJ/RimL family protein N-acetyltransferase